MQSAVRSEGFSAYAAAVSIRDILRDNADLGETSGRLAPASVAALRGAGMLDMWRPLRLGGHQCDPVEYAIAAEEVAVADTAAAWTMHGVSATWFDLRLGSDELVDEVTASESSPVLAETYNAPMLAEPVSGGFRVSGKTPFASGCVLADWIGHTARDGSRFLLLYHPRGVLEIADDWDSSGMRGTASNRIAACDVFVPQHRVIELSSGPAIGARFEGPLYRMPPAVIPVAVAAVSLGALRGALDAASEIAENKTPFASSATLKNRALAQLHFGRALAMYRSSRAFLHDVLGTGFNRAERGEDFDLRAKADLFLAYAHTIQTCADAVRLLAKAVGTSAVYKGNAVERALRDVEVISHHAFGAEGRFATVAQAYWGVPIDFPMLAMD